MQSNAHLSLYNKFYGLIKTLYQLTRSFPKEYKYTLGQDILALAWANLDLVIEANALPNNCKKVKIIELSTVFDKLKMRIRLSQEINLLTVRQFAHLQDNYLLAIGREIGGWLKWAEGSGK
jgi:hypothetical protein